MLDSFIISFNNSLLPDVINAMVFFIPLWLPIVLFGVFWNVWINYIRIHKIKKTGYVLLEIKIPKEVNKSPAAMEIIIGSLSQPGKGTPVETFWEGNMRPWYSLELVSDGGQVHFYIWAQPKFKNHIESQIYGQYPNVEVIEVEDYVKKIPFTENFWGTQYKLTKPDPIPIKTFIEYGLDKDPKEEYKIDPMTATLEYLGSVKPGHTVWIQILIQTHREENFLADGILFENFEWKNIFNPKDWDSIFTRKSWKDREKDNIKSIIEKIRKESIPEDADPMMKFPNPTRGQTERIASIERTVSKPAFDTMIRGLYIWNESPIDAVYISGLIGAFKQYNSETLNGFKLGFFTDISNDIIKDILRIAPKFKDSIVRGYKYKMFDAYKRRLHFHPPYTNLRHKPFILTTEELATIFHFPGQVATTPTFEKIASRKAEPPANLPI